ncbi:MAG: DNA replication and repair protein RecF [bacterium]|nr:DNA replication and repair protein RecF [bacterium]
MLKSISIQDFRCFAGASWAPGSGRHILVGDNGAGKTSVLEAIYFLATTRSFRSSRLADCVRWQHDGFWVSGRLEGDRGTELVASWKPGGGQRLVNGKSAPLSDYLAVLPAFSWSTRDNPLLDGEPEARRRLLDQGIVSKKPLEVEVLSRYRRVLVAKRRLLADGGGTSSGDTLESWNRLLAEFGNELIRLRYTYLSELQAALAETLIESGIELQPVELRYRPNPESGAESVEGFLRALELERKSELRRRRSLVGPHRDRLEIRWGMSDIGRSASAGERKLFGLVLTAARRRALRAGGREPIILLDDLDATLDGPHLEAAWRLFDNVPQVVASSADPATGRRFNGVSSWCLKDGRIEPL